MPAVRTFRKLGVEMPITYTEAHDVSNALAKLAENAPAGGLLGADDVKIGVTISYNKRSSTFNVTVGDRKFCVLVQDGHR